MVELGYNVFFGGIAVLFIGTIIAVIVRVVWAFLKAARGDRDDETTRRQKLGYRN